ncbi:4047_t:CDS:2, partial [Ambispora gerdemannii]
EKGLKKYWNSFKTVLASKKGLSTMGIGLVISYLYVTHESPGAQDRNMADVFKKGKIDQGVSPPISKKLVKRENLENVVKNILQFSLQNYFLISGEHGTGKTTLVQNAILSLQEPKGVIHFECPSDAKEFAKNLSKHLDYELYPFKLRDIIIMQLTTNAIRKADYYMKKYKRPIVLVLDQVDRIAKKDPEFLGMLQDFAKSGADRDTLVIVFIASEGSVPQIMKSRSAWSRASATFEVGDISDEEAVKFLQDSVKYLTGGRFALLKNVQELNRVDPKNLVEKFKEQTFTQIKRDLDTVDLPENHEFFIKLIEVDRIAIKKAKTIIPLDTIHKLVEANILKEHQDYTVSFHSRYIDTYFKE